MTFIPNSEKTIKQMLRSINKDNFDNLFDFIPENMKFNNELNIGKPLSEYEIINYIKKMNDKNVSSNKIIFTGKGIYDHFVPSIVDFLSSRSEFYTAYTPYQPEVSQGTLQCLYEYQTMICELSKMDISNASIYDGASSLFEACIMANSYNKKNTILLSETIYENYIDVVKAIESNLNLNIEILSSKNGVTDLSKINNLNDLCSVVIQSPNKYGILESWQKTSDIIKDSNTVLIAISNPLVLNHIKAPGDSGADIFIADGQCLGNYMNFGGPTLGIMSAKSKFLRKIPGRVIGRTVDKTGKEGFVLTLQTREQHIRRENATSNICTNQNLLAIRALIYMAALGKNGLKKVITLCINKTQYLISEIDKLKNYSVPFKKNIVNEFIVETKFDIDKMIMDAVNEDLFIQKSFYNDKNYLHLAVTEKRTKSDLDKLILFLSNYNG